MAQMDYKRGNEYRTKLIKIKNFLKAFNQLPDAPCGVDNVAEIMSPFSASELNDLFNTIDIFKKKTRFWDFRKEGNVLEDEIKKARDALTWDDTHIVSEETRTLDQAKLTTLLELRQKIWR